MIQIDPIRGLVWEGYGYGKVVDGKTVHDQRRVYWVRCPDCGPMPPGVVYNERRKQWYLRDATKDDATCSACYLAAPIREAIIPAVNRRPRGRCSDRCLNGRSTCRCACLGRCHSEGVCCCDNTPGGP